MVEKYTSGDFATNTYVISNGDKAVIVDPTLDFENISKKIKSEYEVIAVLITHAHIDHIDGLKYFLDVPVYISRIDYLYLNSPGYTLYGWYSEELPFHPLELDFHFLDDLEEIDICGFKFKCFLTPGHTEGGMCFLYEDCLFTGDTLFNMSIGRTDFPSGDVEQIYKSIVRIIEMLPEETRVFPGHEGITTIGFEKKNNPFYNDAKGKGY